MNAIPGGWAAYREAVETAYREPMHNPCVRWSLRLGFTAESSLTPSDDDQYTVGGPPTIRPITVAPTCQRLGARMRKPD